MDINNIKNNTNFPEQLNNILKELFNKDNDKIQNILFDYQRYIYNYLVFTDARGILLYHSVGSGKTLTSISIAEEFRKLNKDIIIISSKSLQSNYKKEIIKYNQLYENDLSDDELENIINKYKFVTSNSKNMISSLDTSILDSKLYNILNNKNLIGDDKKINLENKIIIIDEAHNLFNSIVNGSKTANEFYDLIMSTKKIKLIFLTGTPIINDPFEICVAFNMLYGPIKIDSNFKYKKSNKEEYTTILPEYYSDFKKYFINESNNTLKNEYKFKNRIYGLVSYYGDMYNNLIESIKNDLKITKIKENYPDRLPIKINVIEMSLLQNNEYAKARDKEKRENLKYGQGINKEKNLVSTSYRIKSRQLSNIFIPSQIELTLYNYDKYSPKLKSIYNNITTYHKNQINLVYSTFLEYGIVAFSKLLELNGYSLFNSNKPNKLYYAIFSGDQTPEEKEIIIKTINSDENKNGELISILLISKSGAEGLDLKNIRSVHIMEPYWNYSLIEQIIARAVRYKSHSDLPKDQQNVQTYIYLSDYNSKYLEKEKEKLKLENQNNKKNIQPLEFTTDINIFKNAIRRQELIQIFLKTIASTSIECKFFNNKNINYNCFNCLPNNKILYYNDIHKDILLSNNCIQSEKIKAEEIIINGIKYYYQKINEEEIRVFQYNEDLDGYQETINEDIKNKILKTI